MTLDNHQTTGGVSKAAAIVQAAHRLADAGVLMAGDLDPSSAEHRRAWCGTRGLGPVTWNYLTMLLGHADVKADIWVVRYVGAALGRSVTADEARELVSGVAQQLHRSPTHLDHAIWLFARQAARSLGPSGDDGAGGRLGHGADRRGS